MLAPRAITELPSGAPDAAISAECAGMVVPVSTSLDCNNRTHFLCQ
jgi:hypothetical protein